MDDQSQADSTAIPEAQTGDFGHSEVTQSGKIVSRKKGGGSRPTKKEHKERWMLVKDMLSKGFTKSKIKELLLPRFKCHWRTIERYVARARRELVADTGQPTIEHRAEGVAYLKSVIADTRKPRDGGPTPRDKIRAQELINRMLGLDQPIKFAPTTPDGQKPWVPFDEELVKLLSDDDLEVLERVAEQHEKLATGTGVVRSGQN